MALEDLRRRLEEALADPQRRQLAHIAVLDIAMGVREALEQRGMPEADIARATEEISAFLTGESGDLSQDLVAREQVLEVLTAILESTSRQLAFARVFGPKPPDR